jgi:hypothetical protein
MTPLAILRHYHRRIDALEEPDPDVMTAASFPGDPVGYAENVLGITTLTDQQKAMLRALTEPPYRVAGQAGHGVGKTTAAAIAINYHYDTYDPGICISTAPDARSVKDVLWAEVRKQRQNALITLGDLQPAAPEMRSGPVHWAKGYTANSGEGFQGRHHSRMLFVFDEAVGIDQVFFQTVETMFSGEPGHAWLIIYNPTDTSSQAFIEVNSLRDDGTPKWKTFTLSCLDHPNVTGKGPYIPGAVSRKQVSDWIQAWCEPVSGEPNATDIEWEGKWYRPGPIFEARCLGRWPTEGAWSVWSDALWGATCNATAPYPEPDDCLPQIGCDVARGGDDYTSIHCRWGPVSLKHDSWNGLTPPQIQAKLEEAARALATLATENLDRGRAPVLAVDIRIKIDDDGTGGAVAAYMQQQGYTLIPIGAGTVAALPHRYPNKRSELWFQVADAARDGGVCFGMLPKSVKERLRQQLMVTEWGLDTRGRRVVEPKDSIKVKIGRSPDDADAFNLAYYEGGGMEAAKAIDIEEGWDERGGKRRVFG